MDNPILDHLDDLNRDWLPVCENKFIKPVKQKRIYLWITPDGLTYDEFGEMFDHGRKVNMVNYVQGLSHAFTNHIETIDTTNLIVLNDRVINLGYEIVIRRYNECYFIDKQNYEPGNPESLFDRFLSGKLFINKFKYSYYY